MLWMAEDDRIAPEVTESLALQSGMDLHLLRRRLQLSPHAKSSDSHDTDQAECVAGRVRDFPTRG